MILWIIIPSFVAGAVLVTLIDRKAYGNWFWEKRR